MEVLILFRKITNPRPRLWADSLHWYVEAFDDEHDGSYPVGIAFCTIAPVISVIDFIYVVDHERRKYVATKLVEACRQKWPDIELTDAISPSGEVFMKSLGDTA